MNLLREITEKLKSAGISTPTAEAKLFLSDVTNKSLNEVFFLRKSDLNFHQLEILQNYIERRCKFEPLQYIIGKAFFRNLELRVGKGVLIPRPETEYIVDLALQELPKKSSLSVCDIGTGSGAIALSIASEIPQSYVYGIDISSEALKYARLNKKLLQLGNIEFIESDLFACFKNNNIKFNLITANLPYVRDDEYSELPPEIKEFEPYTALKAGKDGLKVLKNFFLEVSGFLKNPGVIIAEIGETQSASLLDFIGNIDTFTDIETEVIKDLNGRERYIVCRQRRKAKI